MGKNTHNIQIVKLEKVFLFKYLCNMGLKISVPVLWDANNQWLKGELQAVDIEALIIGEVQKPTGPSVPPFQNQPTTTTLFVKDKTFGGLYLSVTWAQWDALIRAISGSVAPMVQTKTFTISTSTNTITDPVFTGATVLAAWVGGVGEDVTGLLSGDTLTFGQDLNGAKVAVTFYVN